jgi:hypothetical protein
MPLPSVQPLQRLLPINTTIKQQWHWQWQRKQWLQQQGWWASDGNGNNMRNGNGNKVAGNKESNGMSSKSNDNGDKEGNGDSVKSNGDGNEEGNCDGRRGQWQRRQEKW